MLPRTSRSYVTIGVALSFLGVLGITVEAGAVPDSYSFTMTQQYYSQSTNYITVNTMGSTNAAILQLLDDAVRWSSYSQVPVPSWSYIYPGPACLDPNELHNVNVTHKAFYEGDSYTELENVQFYCEETPV